MNDALNGRKTDTRAFKLIRPVEALEYAEKFIDVLHVKTDSVVPDKHYHTIGWVIGTSDFNFRYRPRAREFDRIRNQIYERDLQHRSVSIQIRQRPDLPCHITAFCLPPYFVLNFLHKLFETHH